MFGGETPLQGISTSRGLLLPLAAIAAYILQGWQVGLSWFTASLPCSKISSFPALHSVAECSFSHLFPISLRALEVRIQRTPLYWLHLQRGCTWESEFAHTKEENGETPFWFGLVWFWLDFLFSSPVWPAAAECARVQSGKKGTFPKTWWSGNLRAEPGTQLCSRSLRNGNTQGVFTLVGKPFPGSWQPSGNEVAVPDWSRGLRIAFGRFGQSPSWVSLLAKSVFWP